MNNTYFILFSNCIPVKGFSSSLIVDLQNGNYIKIPNLLFEVLNYNICERTTISSIKEHFNNKYDQGIDVYFNFLVEKELGFFAENIDSFPPLSKKFEFYGAVSNSILYLNEHICQFSEKIVAELSVLGCIALELRVEEKMNNDSLTEFMQYVYNSNIRGVELILPFKLYNQLFPDFVLQDFIKMFSKVISVAVHSSTITGIENDLIHVKKNICKLHCGNVSPNSFLTNIKSFTESLHHNSCLNRKLSIDADGNIKNCPSMSESFGNIRDTTLAEAINKPGFQKYWNITKDHIHVCKDCEYRYICTDCRAYVEDPEDILSKPLKCGYNPYTGEWSEWSTNPLKQKAIDFYGMKSMVEYQDKISD